YLDRPRVCADLHHRADHAAKLPVSARIRDPAFVEQVGFTDDRARGIALPGMQAETHAPDAVALQLLDEIGVQRGGARPGVDLGLHPPDAELRQRQPFPPADAQQLAHTAASRAMRSMSSR